MARAHSPRRSQLAAPMGALLVSLALLLLLVAATATAASAEVKHLEQFLEAFEEARASMEPRQRELAEFFGAAVGNKRMYVYELRLLAALDEPADLSRLLAFLEAFPELRQVGDADALISAIKFAAPEVSAAQLASAEQLGQLAERLLAPACRALLHNLNQRGLFEGDQLRAAQTSGQLAGELLAAGPRPEVREFLLGWAHYHACKLLLTGDNGRFFGKASRRSADHARLAAKLAARRAD